MYIDHVSLALAGSAAIGCVGRGTYIYVYVFGYVVCKRICMMKHYVRFSQLHSNSNLNSNSM